VSFAAVYLPQAASTGESAVKMAIALMRLNEEWLPRLNMSSSVPGVKRRLANRLSAGLGLLTIPAAIFAGSAGPGHR
jgi:hypothetical protein